MPADDFKGPAERVLATSVARRYYLDNRTKVDIAEEFQLSRFKVARLLEAAVQQGLVRFEIGDHGLIDLDLSVRLQDSFGLRHALVIDLPDDHESSLRQQLGAAAADLLTEIVTPEDVLGLFWARTVGAMATQLRRLPPVPVVQLTGALSRSVELSSPIDDISSIDVVREVARVARGPAYLFFAPFLVSDAAVCRALRKQPDVARAFGQISSVTKAVAGIGKWGPGQSTLYDAASEADRRALDSEGVCADVGGVFLDEAGQPVQTSLTDRMIGVTADQLRGIKEIIGIPYGLRKQAAVEAALRSGMINSLVTHESLARALLSDARPDPPTGTSPAEAPLTSSRP